MPNCPKEKVSYPTFEAAKAACGSIARMNYRNGRKREKIRAYICGYCGQWHVGRGPKGKDADWETAPVFVRRSP